MRKGFTLIELLVVISIVAMLSSIVMASLGSARSKSRDTIRETQVREIGKAFQQYALDNNNRYPNPGAMGCTDNLTNDGWFCLGHGNGDTCWGATQRGCTALDAAIAPYMPKIPDDPLNDLSKGGDAYLYHYSYNINGVPNLPALHWGIEQKTGVTNATCGPRGMYGIWGHWSKYYCIVPAN